MIDIIIPCYNSHTTIEKTLNSIIIQSMKDKIHVLIVDDHSNHNYDSILAKYQKYLPINQISLELNSGSGIAREKGIEITNNKYIIFLDSDDTFYDVDAVKNLYDKIEEGYDVVTSQEFDQRIGLFLYQNGNLHGKIYGRSYLEKNDIHFNISRFHEDNYFHNYVRISGANITSISDTTYFYSNNKNSITQKNYDSMKNMDLYLSNLKELLLIAEDRNYDKDIVRLYLEEKQRYLNNTYHKLQEEEKDSLLELLKKYNLEFIID